MQASRQACAACGKRMSGETGGVAAGAIVRISPGSYAAGILGVTFDHKLHKSDDLLACGYYSRRGYAAPFQAK